MNLPVDIDTIQDPDMKAMCSMFQSMIEQLNETIRGLHEALARKEEENALLKKMIFGQKSERGRKPRVPSPKDELNKAKKELSEEEKQAKLARTRELRAQKREERRKKLPIKTVVINVPAEMRHCSACGRDDNFARYTDEITERIEHVPEHLLLHQIIRERISCRCGKCILTAPAPPTVTEGTHYGPGLYAHVIVDKCLNSMPLNRQAKSLRRAGAEISTRTLGDLFHRAADLCRPIAQRILDQIALSDYVQSDETKLAVKAKGKCKKHSMWVFIAGKLVGFVFSPGSGQATPEAILKGSVGTLQSDGHACYNSVCEPNGHRIRAGCWGHSRRKFFDAKNTAPQESDHALAEILALYEVEYRAIDLGIWGTEKHQMLRQTESRPIIDRFKIWLEAQNPEPKSPLGKAIKYTLNQYEALSAFLNNVDVFLDNNGSERELRIIAQGRKNFLFVGNAEAGESLAVLQTVVATCQAYGVNPYDYLRDVLVRVSTHPMSRLDELMPDRWEPPDGDDPLRPKTTCA